MPRQIGDVILEVEDLHTYCFTRWGVLLRDAQTIQAVVTYPWLLIPVACLIIAVLSFNLLGDGVRDAVDPYA